MCVCVWEGRPASAPPLLWCVLTSTLKDVCVFFCVFVSVCVCVFSHPVVSRDLSTKTSLACFRRLIGGWMCICADYVETSCFYVSGTWHFVMPLHGPDSEQRQMEKADLFQDLWHHTLRSQCGSATFGYFATWVVRDDYVFWPLCGSSLSLVETLMKSIVLYCWTVTLYFRY